MAKRAPDGELLVVCPRCGKDQRASSFEGYRICRYCRTLRDELEVVNRRDYGPEIEERLAIARADRIARERERERRRNFVSRYEITHDEHRRLLDLQQHRCAICDQPPPPPTVLNIDHDHETNEVRGLLCRSCNLALGFLGDDIERLENAIAYLLNPPREQVRD